MLCLLLDVTHWYPKLVSAGGFILCVPCGCAAPKPDATDTRLITLPSSLTEANSIVDNHTVGSHAALDAVAAASVQYQLGM